MYLYIHFHLFVSSSLSLSLLINLTLVFYFYHSSFFLGMTLSLSLALSLSITLPMSLFHSFSPYHHSLSPSLQEGEQGQLPVLILSLREDEGTTVKKPAVVFLHSSYKTKEWVRPLLEVYPPLNLPLSHLAFHFSPQPLTFPGICI